MRGGWRQWWRRRQQQNIAMGDELKKDLKRASLPPPSDSLAPHYIVPASTWIASKSPTMLPNLKLLNKHLRLLKDLKCYLSY